MLFKIVLILFSALVIALSYLPLRQQNNYVATEQNQLFIDMHQTQSLLLNRPNPEKRYRVMSDSLTYDEAHDLTVFTPFALTGHTGQQSIKANAAMGQLTQLEMNLIDQVILQQSTENKQPRRFFSDQLRIHLKTHQLISPNAIRVTDDTQQIEADSLIGNYEEGWYEFTQHVKTQWQ